VWLTVTLAVFRYIAVCHHAVAKRICTLRHARMTAACIVVAAVVVCIPTYIMYEPRQLSNDATATASNSNNDSFGLAVRYEVEVPKNLSATVLLYSETDGQNLHGGAGFSGYWFTQKEFVGTTFQSVNFWVYGVALKTAPCILLTVLSALLIRAIRAAELRHRRLVQRRPVLSSFSASPRMDIPACTVRRHHTFEEPRNQSQSELNGATLAGSPSRWKRSFSERIKRSVARLSIGEEPRLGKAASSADKIQDNPSSPRDERLSDLKAPAVARATHGRSNPPSGDFQDNPDTPSIVPARKYSRNSTVIAKTVGGDVVVELTRVDDDSCSAAEYHASDLSLQDDVGGSVHLRMHRRSGQSDETTHLRVDTPEYRTFDSDEDTWNDTAHNTDQCTYPSGCRSTRCSMKESVLWWAQV